MYHDVSHVADVKGNERNMLVTIQCKSKDNDADDDQMKEDARIEPKPRTALFKEGEDDEPMASQNIPVENSCPVSNMVTGLLFGAFL